MAGAADGEEGRTLPREGHMGIRGILLIAAVILFVIGAVGADLGDVNLLYVGLACFAASFLVGELPAGRRKM
jgi:hypothetical protein